LRKRNADGVDQQVSQDQHCIARKRSIMTGNFGSILLKNSVCRSGQKFKRL
jgi:hypothetical protein